MALPDLSSYWNSSDLIQLTLPVFAASIGLFFFAGYLYEFPKSQVFICLAGFSFAIWGIALII